MTCDEERNRYPKRKRHLAQPCLILMMGVAGSGKTTLSKKILRHVWTVYLDNNHIVDAFFPDCRNGRAYDRLRPKFYQALYTIVEENLKAGNSILLDAPHVKEMQNPLWRRSVQRLAARTNGKIVIIRCLCSETVLRARLRARAEKRDERKLANWKRFLAEQPIRLSLRWPHLDIDTEKALTGNVDAAIRYIDAQAQPG